MKDRDYSFDVLRIMAMFFIVVFHFFVHGVMHHHTTPEIGFALCEMSSLPEIINFFLSESCLVVVSTGVNLFVMISGYFLITRTDYRIHSLIRLWIRVFFYSVVISIAFYCLGKGSLADVLRSFFPLITSQYWFIVVYFALMAVAPFLSKLANSISQADYKTMLLALFLINFIVPFGRLLSGGGHLLWFVFLYLLAGYIRLYPMEIKRIRTKTVVIGMVIILCYISYAFIPVVKSGITGQTVSTVYLVEPSYNSLVFFLSVLIFCNFMNRSLSLGKYSGLIRATSSSTLGVYLLTDHGLVRDWLWENLLECQLWMKSLWAWPTMVLFCSLIFVFTLFVDFLVGKCLDRIDCVVYGK